MQVTAYNREGRVVAGNLETNSVDEALSIVYRWNATERRDGTREHMLVSSVKVDGRVYPVSVQMVMF